MHELRVLVVGDDPLARSGLAALLAGQGGVVIAGQAATDAEGDLHDIDADVAVWDPGTGGEADYEALAGLARAGLPVLALVSHERHVQDALAAGATGAVGRDADPERLVAGLRAVAQGLVVLDQGLARTALRPRPVLPQHPLDALTPRELEVLQLLAQGLSNKAIAEGLGISEHTAKFHVNTILSKLDADNRAEAIVRAVRMGLVVL